MRKIISFNEDWFFQKTAEIPKSLPFDRETGAVLQGWEAVNLPHTWNALDGQDGGNDYWRGTAMYCKQFPRPDWDGRVFLECNGAAMTADVYLNGQHLAHHEGGYSTFRVELTDYLRGKKKQDNQQWDNQHQEDQQLLCIAVDNGVNDRVYPQKADFTFYGGLYRDVNLICVPEQHFELVKDGTPGIKVTPIVENGTARVKVEAWVKGQGEVAFSLADSAAQRNVSVGDQQEPAAGEASRVIHQKVSGLKDISGDILQKTAASEDGYAATEFILENAHLWDGVEDPYLYTVKAAFGGDEVSARFGCRTFDFDPEKGFYLNGKAYPLRGVSRHQDRKGLGNALTIKEHREDMEIVREIGANALRLAHYQHAREFYDLCDEYGIIVWAEIPYITQHMPKGKENTVTQMRELITQCYNHPSICCWGLSNEITASGAGAAASGGVSDSMEDLMENHRILNELCHRMDETRPTTMAHVFMLETDSPLIEIADIGSYNLYFGWYLGELEQNDSFLDSYHVEHPGRVMGFSEYGADANPQFQSAHPEKGDYSESYQCVYHEHLLTCIEERPWLWATHVWNLFDFGADGRDEGGKGGENQKGLVTFDRKLKKDAFYLYKAHWSRVPFVHICGRRYVNRAEETTEIKVYSNQPEVSLFVDGRLAETKRADKVFVFQLSLSGEHCIEARCGGSGNTAGTGNAAGAPEAVGTGNTAGAPEAAGTGNAAGAPEAVGAADTVRAEVSDQIIVRKVSEPDVSYQMAKREEVVNWFDREKVDFTCFSIQDTMGEIMATSAGAAILGRMMEKARASRGDVAQSAGNNPVLQKMLAKMTVQSILKQAGGAVSGEEIKSLNAALQKIRKPEAAVKQGAVAKQRSALSVDSQLTQVFDCEEGRELFDRFLPGVREFVMKQEAMPRFTVRKLASYSRGRIGEDVLAALDQELQKVEIWVEADTQEGKKYTFGQPFTNDAAEVIKEPAHTEIYPGRPWRDTEGKRIQAHGGGLFYEDGIYYWYGENKDRTDGECPVWTWGIRSYSSQDLCNWEDMGLIIEPDLEHPEAGMYPEHHIDRPHIVKCRKTGKYVCWLKQSGEEACFLILQADVFTGPYTVVAENYRPFGIKVGDFDIAEDDATGKAFLYMDGDHTGILGMELSEDFLRAEKVVSRQYENLHAPFSREAPAVFQREGKKYMLTSGMSGYIPNRSDAAVSDSFTEPFVSVGDPHVADETRASFNSQISQVFQVPGKKNLYIAIADRWVPRYPVDAGLADLIERVIASHYDPERYQVTAQERQEFMGSPMLEAANTSIADYVWLPLTFEGDQVRICWQDEWTPEDYE